MGHDFWTKRGVLEMAEEQKLVSINVNPVSFAEAPLHRAPAWCCGA